MPLVGRKAIGTCAFMGGVYAVPTEFAWSWGEMLYSAAIHVCESHEYIHRDRARASFHSAARNNLADRMLGDWLFMLDTDHEFEPDLLARLLHRMNEHNLDVVTGLYQFKTKPHSPVLYGWHEGGFVPLAGWKGDLIEVGASGAGSLLVRRTVFDRIREELGERPFDVIGQGGEDFGFYHRLRKLGVKAWCDTRVEYRHLVARGVTLADHQPPGPGETLKIGKKMAIVD